MVKMAQVFIAITAELYWLIGLGMIGNFVISFAVYIYLIKLKKALELERYFDMLENKQEDEYK